MVNSPIDFFRTMELSFSGIITGAAQGRAMIATLAGQAFDWFENNVAIQADGLPPLACEKGCPTCCSLRVTATAPEIFLLAFYVRQVEATSHGEVLGLARRITEAHHATGGMSEQERLALAMPCPLLLAGQCILHPVRTLACRGHAAFSVEQCRAAVRGEDVNVAVSEPHVVVRGMVQNALQSALRRHGLAWALYDLNQGLALVLEDESRMQAWLAGEDSLAPAIPDLDLDALGSAFDRLSLPN